ncbi:hypothetical protein BP5796_04285 [Coleophoma crateriformis]|uniref:Fatty acid desaturase domain-containing protein n=1 Tax=Coleophoma crateriformis TaxID=565419 RepID=A0A3D8SI14_9HELO|nr:hypothetical protein BP5796_04285 [Coleophoma crateriformis]
MTATSASTEASVPPKLAAQRAKYGMLMDASGNEYVVPDYTLKQIYDAIPKECFERNVLKSLRYLCQDIALITGTFLAFSTYNTSDYISSPIIRFALWSVYSFMQMIFGCGIWILAHECGHMAFSQYKTLNDTIGLILHSSLLVPYFSWKITHKYHHKGVGNMATDTAFTPHTRLSYAQSFNKTIEEIAELVEDAPIYAFTVAVIQQLFTWQLYTLTMMGVGEAWFEKKAAREGVENPEKNEDGSLKRTYGLSGSLFNPYSPYFTELDAKLIYINDAALLVVFSLLYYVGVTYGWGNLIVWYAIPYLLINSCVIFIASLQHLDPSMPHYNSDTWTFIRGAASTIDRDLGFIGHYFWHDANETHVLHHHIGSIPHYHAVKATEAIKPLMGKSYRKDESGMSNIMNTFRQTRRACQWVESSTKSDGEGKGVLFFNSTDHIKHSYSL